MRRLRAAGMALCVLLCCALPGCSGKTAVSDLSFVLDVNGTQEPISCFAEPDGSLTVFLPSCARMDKLAVSLPGKTDAKLGETVLADGTSCDAFRTDTDYDLTVGNEKTRLRFLQAKNVPALFVHTKSGSMDFVHAQKTEKEPARLLLLEADGKVAYRSADTDSIRGRGNSTWSKEKKPYNLYLRQPADLLGMGEAAEWVLLANAFDETNLRCHTIFDFAQRVSGDPAFAPDTAFADVYLCGEYAGLYLLSEKVQIAENRLEIAPDSVLFSWVQTARNDSFFALDSTESVQIESPEICTAAEQQALETKLLSFQNALYGGGNWQEYIDLDSFTRKYLIEEVFSNYDLRNSQYFYMEPDGRLYAGPCWDYDLTLGISWRNTWSTPNGFSAQNRQNENETWYSALWKQEAFRDRALTLFRTEFLPLLETLPGEIGQQARGIAASSEMNARRWRSLFGEHTSAQAADDMTRFLSQRTSFLRAAWVDGTEYRTLTLCHPVRYEYISVLPGTVCTEFPTPESLDLPAGTVWLRADTGEPFDPQSAVTQDVTLVLPQQPKPINRNALVMCTCLAAMAGLVAAATAVEAVRRRKRRRQP